MTVDRGEFIQRTLQGGAHTFELARPAAPVGVEGGYIRRRLAAFAVFGCTCGAWFEGDPEQAGAVYRAHVDELGGDWGADG